MQTATPDKKPRVVQVKPQSFGSGSLIQWAGVPLIIFAIFGSFAKGFAIFALLAFIGGVALLIFGGRVARRLECSECGTKVSRQDVRTCPGCRANFM